MQSAEPSIPPVPVSSSSTQRSSASLETSTSALVLTGNLRPSAAVLQRANELDVTVLLVATETLETIEKIERIFGKTRLGHAEKLAHFESLMAEYVNYRRLFELLEI